MNWILNEEGDQIVEKPYREYKYELKPEINEDDDPIARLNKLEEQLDKDQEPDSDLYEEFLSEFDDPTWKESWNPDQPSVKKVIQKYATNLSDSQRLKFA